MRLNPWTVRSRPSVRLDPVAAGERIRFEGVTPDALPPETRIGAWRVVSFQGKGAYGAVYKVEPIEGPPGALALKLALYPRDARFEREAELLSRIRHPAVPRLHERGGWEMPGGGVFPYLVMEWVEGVPLYEWAAQQPRTSRQDDLYALGITAYRLVAGRYPPPVELKVEEEGFEVISPGWEEPETWGSLAPELGELIRQLLSDEPHERGRTAEVAEGLEHAEKHAGPYADQPIVSRGKQTAPPPRAQPKSPRLKLPWKRGLAWAAGVGLAVSVGRTAIREGEPRRRTDGRWGQGGACGSGAPSCLGWRAAER
jgi:serine/threonine protein kinase